MSTKPPMLARVNALSRSHAIVLGSAPYNTVKTHRSDGMLSPSLTGTYPDISVHYSPLPRGNPPQLSPQTQPPT